MRFRVRERVRRAFRLALRRRDLTEQEIDEELRPHVALRVAQLMARGLTRTEAERETFLRLGGSWEETMGTLQAAGHVRDDRLDTRVRLADARADLRYALRTITRQPGFAIVVILTLALGIGANSVVRRTHEFGVGMALGARVADVVRLVMDQGIRAALVGVAVGSVAAFSLRRVIEPLLFQTSPSSPWAYGVAAVLIVVVAAGASFLPAWRASRVDPVTALRGE